MREILFRGKRIDNGEWVEGGLLFLGEPRTFAEITYPHAWEEGKFFTVRAEVDPATVGQYTGLTDKNGKKIFEGDIVIIQNNTPFEMTGEVVFEGGCFELHDPECDMYEYLWYKPKDMTVLGNIHDNPELLKGGNT